MKPAVLISLALLYATAAGAQEMRAPAIVPAAVDWSQVAVKGEALTALNAAAERHFPGIGKSPVPVLLPLDADALAKSGADDVATDRFVRANFHATKFFAAGPAGYDAVFALTASEVGELSDIRYKDPVYVLTSGLRFTYTLNGPPLPQGEPVKALEERQPG